MRTGLVFFAAMLTAFSVRVSGAPLDDATVWIYGEGAADAAVGGMRVREVQLNPVADRVSRRKQALTGGRNDWSVSLGYAHDTLSAGDLSDWRMNMSTLRFTGAWRTRQGFAVVADISHGIALGGDVGGQLHDDDDATVFGSWTSQVSLGVGWRFPSQASFGVTPLVGYAYRRQDLRGSESIYDLGDPESRLKVNWHGPWVGVRLDAQTQKFDFLLGVKHRWFDYRASFEGDDDFDRDGDSHGWQVEAGAAYRFSPNHAMTLGLDWQRQQAKKDIDVDWRSWSANLGYRMNY